MKRLEIIEQCAPLQISLASFKSECNGFYVYMHTHPVIPFSATSNLNGGFSNFATDLAPSHSFSQFALVRIFVLIVKIFLYGNRKNIFFALFSANTYSTF